MKITKNSYDELKILYNDLAGFLTELKYDDLSFRMIVLEYANADAKTLSYFDSEKDSIIKETLNAKSASCSDGYVLNYLKADPETAIVESTLPAEDETCAKKLHYFVVFDFKDKVTSLLANFLRRYQRLILQHLNGYGGQFADLLKTKYDAFNDAVRQYIDLDIILTLAGSRYEQRDSVGSIIYIKNRRDAEYKIRFAKEIEFSLDNLRMLRKFLEMSDKNLSLIVYEKKVVGLGAKDTLYRKVQFSGHQNWTLNINQKEILRFSRGKFFFDRGYNEFFNEMPKGFILKKFEKPFSDITSILASVKHGALLIITDKAKEEVDRLSGFNRGFAISPLDLVENLRIVKNLASVDGALFIDRQMRCYGAGIILDGVAKRSGSGARGARYNSASCYLDNKTDAPYVAMVFSEDETVDVIINAAATLPLPAATPQLRQKSPKKSTYTKNAPKAPQKASQKSAPAKAKNASAPSKKSAASKDKIKKLL
ncbi:MAG: hypothetical protein FWE84_05345 [Firmicutes bacterium]|nr:hypothetical protein [Bacillota bacterium]